MRILLVNPSNERDILSTTVLEIPYIDSEAFFAPHAIAAIAAVTPEGHDITLHDEQIRGPVGPLLAEGNFDVIGITLVSNQFGRALAIIESYREMGGSARLVVGGIGVSAMMARLTDKVDAVFVGEAEETWPRFLEDLEAGSPGSLYQRAKRPDMARVPPPRWDLIAKDIPRYSMGSVQTTRGCPFDCSFCDVIYTFGRKPRSKTVQQILDEVKALHELGVKMVFFADDNFCGNKKYAREVLSAVTELNNSFDVPLSFITQVDITIADDEELLCMMADCNLIEVQLGVESVDAGSLDEMNKKQNLRMDLVEAVTKIQAHGIIALCHMIIGADSDDETIFERTVDFLDRANVTQHTCHPLMAPPGTRLWYSKLRAGRLVEETSELADKLDIVSNIVPAKMTRAQMMRGLADYWEQVHAPEPYVKRALGFLHGIERRPRVKETRPPLGWIIRMMTRLFVYYLFRVPSDQRRAFFAVFKATRKHAPHMIPTMIFVHTGYVMDRKMALRAARLAREQADWEEANPGLVKTIQAEGTMSQNLREGAGEVFTEVFSRVRTRVPDRAALYEVAVEAVLDFNDRFGETYDNLDDVARENLHICCDRAVESLDEETIGVGGGGFYDGEKPPAGFSRDILDAVDRRIRVRDILENQA